MSKYSKSIRGAKYNVSVEYKNWCKIVKIQRNNPSFLKPRNKGLSHLDGFYHLVTSISLKYGSTFTKLTGALSENAIQIYSIQYRVETFADLI